MEAKPTHLTITIQGIPDSRDIMLVVRSDDSKTILYLFAEGFTFQDKRQITQLVGDSAQA